MEALQKVGEDKNDVKILFTSDWQCCLSNLDKCEITLSHILDTCYDQKVDAVVCLGDVKDAFNPVDQRVTNFLVRATEAINEACPGKFLVLLGNHDRTTTADDSQSCLPVLEAAGAMTFEQPGVFYFGEDVYIRMVPFMRDTEKLTKAFAEKVSEVDKARVMLLGFHNEIRDCKLNVQSRSTGALSLSDIHPEYYTLCLGGHIHYHQQIGAKTYYIGSPFSHDWGEANQTKGSVLLVMSTKEDVPRIQVRGIESPIRGMYDPSLPGFPGYMKDWEGARIRIRVPIKSDPAKTIEFARKNAEGKYPDAILHLVPVYEEANPDISLTESVSDDKILQEYLDQNPPATGSKEAAFALLKRVIPPKPDSGKGLCLKRVSAKDTLCFSKAELDFQAKGLTLITGKNLDWRGSNGSGKSSLLSLPVIGLFGSTLKGQSHDKWKRTNSNGSQSSVVLEASTHDGKNLTITRCRNPQRLDVTLEGRHYSMGDARETQKLIESSTGLNWDVLVNSLYVGQRDVATVLTGTDKERKELFAKFLGLERFSVAQDKIKKRISDRTRDLNSLKSELEALEISVSERENILAKATNTVVQVRKEEREKLNKEMSDTLKAMAAIEKNQSGVKEFLETNQTNFEKYLDKSLRAEAKMEEIKEWLEKSSSVKTKCPLCGSETSVGSLEKHSAHLEDELTRWEAELVRWEKQKAINRRKRDKVLEKKNIDERELKRLQVARYNLQTSLAVLEERQAAADKAQKLMDSLSDVLKKDRSRLFRLELLVQEGTKDYEFLNYCFSVVSRNGLPSYLCAKICPTLNSVADKYSEDFSDGEIKVRFEVNCGDLDVQIINQHGGKAITDQSEGELRTAGLITIFSFREVLVPCNVLVLDEPGEGLDAENAAVFARSLSKIAERFGSVFVTSHNTNILGALEPSRHIEVVKKNGISTVTVL